MEVLTLIVPAVYVNVLPVVPHVIDPAVGSVTVAPPLLFIVRLFWIIPTPVVVIEALEDPLISIVDVPNNPALFVVIFPPTYIVDPFMVPEFAPAVKAPLIYMLEFKVRI